MIYEIKSSSYTAANIAELAALLIDKNSNAMGRYYALGAEKGRKAFIQLPDERIFELSVRELTPSLREEQ